MTPTIDGSAGSESVSDSAVAGAPLSQFRISVRPRHIAPIDTTVTAPNWEGAVACIRDSMKDAASKGGWFALSDDTGVVHVIDPGTVIALSVRQMS